MSSSEGFSSDSTSGSGTSTQALPHRGAVFTSKRKSTFQPPRGAVLVGGPDDTPGIIDMGEFDWNSIKDDKDIELWLVRIPDSVRPFPWFSPFLPLSSGLVTGSSSHPAFSPRTLVVQRRILIEPFASQHFVSRLNQNISTMQSSTLPPHPRRMCSVKSSGDAKYMICGLSATGQTTTLTTTRLAGMRWGAFLACCLGSREMGGYVLVSTHFF